MTDEFGECYPLHLGVTEAGDGEDGRIKSAIGIGTLLEDGIGDTIRVSLTEDPEFEIPVCRDIVKRYAARESREVQKEYQTIGDKQVVIEHISITEELDAKDVPPVTKMPYSPFEYKRRETYAVDNIGETSTGSGCRS